MADLWYHTAMPLPFILLIPITLYVLYALYPPLGGRSRRGQWLSSPNFNKQIFTNQIPTSMNVAARDVASLIREQLTGKSKRAPKPPLNAQKVDVAGFLAAETPQLIWLGHSTVLLRINGKTILTDPILSKRSSPFSFAGPKRIVSERPMTAEELPPIDIVLISHDHYDHLDYATIRKIRNKTQQFFVPLGVAAHLSRWGVKDAQITELDWWNTAAVDGFKITCTPARHFSGRTITDRFKTLWCSWVIAAPGATLFFSGDTGYGPHFKQIGQKCGPFDITLMECGQYDKRWPNIHMMPEDTVRAHEDLGGKRLFPIHWGAFVLALHPWNDSVQRAEKSAQATGVRIVSARLGESMPVTANIERKDHWWNKVNS